MKKINIHHFVFRERTRSLKAVFIKSFIISSILSLVITVLPLLLGLSFGMGLSFADIELEEELPLAKDIYKSGFNKELIQIIVDHDGWIEVIEGDGLEVSQIYGTPEVRKTEYNIEEIVEFVEGSFDGEYNLYNESYLTSYGAFTNETHEYFILIRVPRVKEGNSKWLQAIPKIMTLKVLGPVFLILYCFNIYLFSHRNYTRINKYFEYLKEQLVRMPLTRRKISEDNFQVGEFKDIVRSFNQMIDHLEILEVQKKEIEQNRQELIVNISHDLKTPITSIKGYARFLRDEALDEADIEKYAQIIYESSDHLNKMINLLFEYVKLSHPDFRLQCQEDNIFDFIRDIIAEFYLHIEQQGFQLELELAEEELKLCFDRVQLRRVICNLITNALKYNEKGTSIYISTKKKEDTVEIIVADSGVGIPVELRETIFNPFVREDKARQEKDGSGLGLAISKEIVELHKGKITLEDNEKYMTLFRISLPISENRHCLTDENML